MMKLAIAMIAVLGLSSSFAQQLLYEEQIDVFTDQDTSFAALSTPDYDNFSDDQGVLYLRCDGSESVEVFVVFNAYLGTGDLIPVTYRFDSDEPVQARWGYSSHGDSVFAPPSSVSDFIDGLQRHERLAFRATSYSDRHYTMVFDLADFPEYFMQLRCIGD